MHLGVHMRRIDKYIQKTCIFPFSYLLNSLLKGTHTLVFVSNNWHNHRWWNSWNTLSVGTKAWHHTNNGNSDMPADNLITPWAMVSAVISLIFSYGYHNIPRRFVNRKHKGISHGVTRYCVAFSGMPRACVLIYLRLTKNNFNTYRGLDPWAVNYNAMISK